MEICGNIFCSMNQIPLTILFISEIRINKMLIVQLNIPTKLKKFDILLSLQNTTCWQIFGFHQPFCEPPSFQKNYCRKLMLFLQRNTFTPSNFFQNLCHTQITFRNINNNVENLGNLSALHPERKSQSLRFMHFYRISLATLEKCIVILNLLKCREVG